MNPGHGNGAADKPHPLDALSSLAPLAFGHDQDTEPIAGRVTRHLAFHSMEALELDLSGVSEMDSAGLQLLLAAKKTMQQGDSPLHLVMHSHAVLDALELCQLAAFFGDPTLIPYADHA